ncbi:hypothetical protein Tco_0110260 [Tanacetum coccineum]
MSSMGEMSATIPLLTPHNNRRTTSLSLLLGRASGRSRHGASMLVRETAARQLEERRADWGYSKPVVALDMTWNMAFVVVSVVMLFVTWGEKPNVPVRVWVVGYGLQCALHVVLVWLEYCRRNNRREDDDNGNGNDTDQEEAEEEEGRIGAFLTSNRVRLPRYVASSEDMK